IEVQLKRSFFFVVQANPNWNFNFDGNLTEKFLFPDFILSKKNVLLRIEVQLKRSFFFVVQANPNWNFNFDGNLTEKFL
ncbi:hypothetical protein ED857_19930, partial [Acinetobacter baumannii]